MPKDRHFSRISLEADKVEDERVDDLVRKGVLLVEEDSDEHAVRAWSPRVSGRLPLGEAKRSSPV
jgi:hypothetical protein